LTEDLDEIYRRASALDPSRPSEAVRRKVLEHAAALAAAPPRPAANRARWRPAIFGTLAAAGLAGLLVMPRVFNPHAPTESADTAARAKLPPVVAASRPASAPPLASAPPMNSASTPPQIPPPEAAARSRAAPDGAQTTAAQEGVKARPRTADASRLVASRLKAADQPEAVARPDAAAQSGAVARPRAAAHPDSAPQPATPLTDPSTELRWAAESGDIQTLRAILAAEVRIDAPDARGRTALMLAASRGQAESVDVLLAHGADPNAADANGTTPLKAALAADQPAIVAALRRAGAH
jgi:uncharacterized protein